jgi:prepilin-type processing-associated H-X9-DG protein
MDDNLVGYLLNALDPDTHRDVARYVRDHPEAQQRLERLRQALVPLAADRDEIDPPRGLAIRTLARVAEYRCRELPRAPVTAATRTPSRSRGGWRRIDALVAAALLLAAGGIVLPLRSKVMAEVDRVACKNNQKEFWAACERFRDVKGHQDEYPNVAEHKPLDVAGITVPVLQEAGVLRPENFSVRCPPQSALAECRATLAELQSLSSEEFGRRAPGLLGCYGYSLGYWDHGQVHGVCRSDDHQVLLADRPPAGGRPGNSPNHGGTGQNVLFVDGHVEWHPTRTLGGDDDLYLNQNQQVGAGVDRNDRVIGSSGDRP